MTSNSQPFQWRATGETREWHPATSSAGCDEIEAALQKQGLDINLQEVVAADGEILKVICIFDGPDADPHAERWKSYQEKD